MTMIMVKAVVMAMEKIGLQQVVVPMIMLMVITTMLMDITIMPMVIMAVLTAVTTMPMVIMIISTVKGIRKPVTNMDPTR